MKNNADALIVSQTDLLPIFAKASQIMLDATIEIAYANFYCAIPTLHFGIEDFYIKKSKKIIARRKGW